MSKLAFCGVCLFALVATSTLMAQVTVPSAGTPDMGAALSQVGPGGTITVTANLEANQTYFVGQSITIRGQNPGITLRSMQFLVNAANVAIRDLVIDGKNALGQRNSTHQYLVRFSQGASNCLLENCKVINPASGNGNGLLNNGVSLESPGSCVQVDTGDNVTIRNCDFFNANDAGIDNEDCIFFSGAPPTSGPVLIEGCTFAAHSRGIQINSPHANVTIRNNQFPRNGTPTEYDDLEVSGIFLATDFNPLGTIGPTGTPIRNLLIEGNVFGSSSTLRMENNGVCLRGPIDGVEIRNNTFTRRVDSEAMFLYVYGKDLYIHDNVANADSNSTGLYYVGARSTQLAYPDPLLFLHNTVVRNEDFTPREYNGMGFSELTDGVLVEKCTFTDCWQYGFYVSSLPHFSIVRDCVFTRCGVVNNGNVDGAVLLQSEACSVLNNTFVDCRDAVSLDPEEYAAITTNPDIATNNCLIAGNYMLRCTRYGIEDTNLSDLVTDVPAQGVRIVNNTIVFPGIAAMALRLANCDVYNNIMHGGNTAITNQFAAPAAQTGPFAVTFRYRGFNLNFNNSYQNFTPTATDVTANPRFVGGLSPTTVAGMALLPDSPALNAGTSNGRDADYRSEIGAWQQTSVDTSVPGGRWELYR